MADDGLLMNWEVNDAPIFAKPAIQSGRWKERLAAKREARGQHSTGSLPSQPHAREIFKSGREDTRKEEYIGQNVSEPPAKRQRFDGDSTNNDTYTAPQNEGYIARSRAPPRDKPVQEETRRSFVAGKLPPGTISISGGAGKKMTFEDDIRKPFVAGKLPPGSILIGGGAGKKMKFQDDIRKPFVAGKLPSGSINTGMSKEVAAAKPGQVVSSLFTFNPSSKTKFEEPEEVVEPAKPSNAPLTDEMATFVNLGLSRRLAAHLSTKMDMKAPTAIQKAAITQMIKDDSDAFIQAETGSGKTLAYLLPIVERLLAMSKDDVQVHRDSGLFAIVLAPTRELCKQIAGVLERLLRCAPWIVGTTVIGGESKQSEKARLRKGVNILIATPGRLSDHLENTEVLKVNHVRWLVLDEGDRLMELGFEEEIKGIVDRIRRRSLQVETTNGLDITALPSRRITVLCSATMKMNVQRLGEISLTDAIHIQADPADEDVSKKLPAGKEVDNNRFSAPAQLKQAYAVVPAKLRLVTLASILKRAFARRGSVMKAIVFISCADSVDFHFAMFSRPPPPPTEGEEPVIVRPELPQGELTKDTIAHGTTFSSDTNSVVLHRLHGSLAQNVRTATLKAFTTSTEPCVLICTDVASRGLDLPNVDYVIEYDPPFSAEDHLHRVGRTARAGREGRALIFLLPGEEEEYISVLASGYKEGKKALAHNTADDLLRKGFGGTGREWEERATEWQLEVERWTQDSPKYLEMARRGYQSHIRAYATHVANERHIFNMQTLHLGHLAKAFALRDKPGSIKVPGLRPSKMTKADRSVAARKAKRGEVDEEKAPEGERVRKQRKLDLDMPSVDGNDAARRMKKKMKEHMAVASEFNIG
jgi:ATP-dependent RNA helicase DDX31/DBP7